MANSLDELMHQQHDQHRTLQAAIAAHLESLAGSVACSSKCAQDTNRAAAQVAEEIEATATQILRLLQDGAGELQEAQKTAKQQLLSQFELTTVAVSARPIARGDN
jgi:hypothetical protein